MFSFKNYWDKVTRLLFKKKKNRKEWTLVLTLNLGPDKGREIRKSAFVIWIFKAEFWAPYVCYLMQSWKEPSEVVLAHFTCKYQVYALCAHWSVFWMLLTGRSSLLVLRGFGLVSNSADITERILGVCPF